MLQIELLIDGLAAGYHLLKEDGSLKIIGFPVGKDRYHHLGFIVMDSPGMNLSSCSRCAVTGSRRQRYTAALQRIWLHRTPNLPPDQCGTDLV